MQFPGASVLSFTYHRVLVWMVAMDLSKSIEGFLLTASVKSSPSYLRLHSINLRRLLEFTGDVDLSEISPVLIRAFFTYLSRDHVARRLEFSKRGDRLSPSAVSNYYKSVRALFDWAEGSALITKNPVAGIPSPRVPSIEPDPFSLEEVKLLLAASQRYVDSRGRSVCRPKSKRNFAMCMLMLDTGVRVGELCRLRPVDVRLDAADVVIIPFGSGVKSRSRVIPISPRTVKALWLFMNSSQFGKAHYLEKSLFGISTNGVRQFLWSLGKASGVPDVHPHRFRYTFAIEYLRNGGDPFTLQRILGHSDLDMVNRYLRVAQSDLKGAHSRSSPVDRWGL